LGSAILSLYSVKDGYLGALNEGQVRALKGVAQSLDYLNDMIKHYLDLSRLEKGELNVRKDWVALRAEVIDPLLETLDAAMAEKSLGVENRVAASLRVHADRDLIKIVYENLLSNAVKYGRESGQLRLGAALDAGAIRLHVENDGEGIARDKIERLFKKFSRLTGEEETGRKGTGLGLFICKAIIEAHGGRMGVESEEGRWTRFSFTLPLQAAEASQDRKSDDDAKEKDTDH
jgi:signal transduction histidine kinase